MTDKGYVALLDVLGFSELVSADFTGLRIKQYLDALDTATKPRGVKSVVFSDSIVLTVEDETASGLLDVAQACSWLLGELLMKGIALRGAIAHGSVFRRNLPQGAFVAGRAIIDAYRFEKVQNWVGVMLAPSAVASVPDVSDRCRSYNPDADLAIFEDRLPWARYIQPCDRIPFRGPTGQTQEFQGYAVVPTTRDGHPDKLPENLQKIETQLEWLCSIAPSPEAQRKYNETLSWLGPLVLGQRTALQSMSERAKQLRASQDKH